MRNLATLSLARSWKKGLYLHFFIILNLSFYLQCMSKLDFENSGDAESDAFLYRGFLTQYLASLAPLQDNSTNAEVPLYLSALLFRPLQSVSVRVYPVDSENGNLGSFFEYARIPVPGGISPGCDPVRVVRVPTTKELLVAGGNNNLIYSFKIEDNETIAPYVNSSSVAQQVRNLAVSPDGLKILAAPESTASPPDPLYRFTRNPNSGALTIQNSGGYPFGLTCAPRSIAIAPNGNNIFVSNITSTSAIQGFLDNNGVITQSSTNITLAANITSNDNICLHPTKSFLYTSIAQASAPLVGLKYDSDSNLSFLPNSPFTPTANYVSTPSLKTRTLAIDPLGKFVAFLYNESSSRKLQLMHINQETGALTPTNNPVSVGNAPNALEWDKSGRFLYFISDDLTNYQIEVYRVLKDGSLQKTLNSPYTITTMAGTGAIPISLSSITKSSNVKIGEYP